MVTLHDMIICELRLGGKQGEGERVLLFFFSGGGNRAVLQDETGDRRLSQECTGVLDGISKVMLLTCPAGPVGWEPDLLEPFWQK